MADAGAWLRRSRVQARAKARASCGEEHRTRSWKRGYSGRPRFGIRGERVPARAWNFECVECIGRVAEDARAISAGTPGARVAGVHTTALARLRTRARRFLLEPDQEGRVD